MTEDYRNHKRHHVRIRAEIRMSGTGKFEVWVNDLSRTGFRMETLSYVDNKRSIFLTLPGMAPLEARVSWWEKDEYGCRFVQPLHDAVFDHIVRLHPTLG